MFCWRVRRWVLIIWKPKGQHDARISGELWQFGRVTSDHSPTPGLEPSILPAERGGASRAVIGVAAEDCSYTGGWTSGAACRSAFVLRQGDDLGGAGVSKLRIGDTRSYSDRGPAFFLPPEKRQGLPGFSLNFRARVFRKNLVRIMSAQDFIIIILYSG